MPLELADYLVRWSVRRKGESILEPCCGDGNFVCAVLAHLGQLADNMTQTRIVAVEIDEKEIGKAQARVSSSLSKGAHLIIIG